MNTQPKSTSAFLISLLLFLASVLLLMIGFLLGFSAFLPLLDSGEIQTQGTIYALVLAFEALVLLLAAYVCFQKYRGSESAERETRFALRGWHVLALIVGTGIALAIGYLIEDMPVVNWLLLPTLTIPAALLPILLLFGFAARKIQLGSRWRVWGVLGLGMTVGPLLLVILETAAIFAIAIVAVFYFMTQPDFLAEIVPLARRLELAQNDPDAVLGLLAPYLTRPGVILTILSIFSVIVPILEELLKPIGVWLFARNLESPAQGFALGALSGAAYTLVETFGSSAQTTGWASLLLTRMGTGLLHITSTALMGWGIALAWKHRRYAGLLVIYLASCALHGAWNASAILFAFSAIAQEIEPEGFLSGVQPFALIATSLLVVGMFAIVFFTNRKLAQTVPEVLTETPTLDQP